MTSASSVWTWGRAKNYRLGRDLLGRDARTPEPVACVAFDAPVVSAACGGGHTAVVRADGALFAFGYSQYGQLGLGDRTDICVPTQVVLPPARDAADGSETDGADSTEEEQVIVVPPRNGLGGNERAATVFSARVVDVSCGRYHTLARTSDGAVYTWGGGKNGRLGHGDDKIRLTPGCVRALLPNKAVAITAGYHNNLVLTEQGDVWSWGWGAHGQLGTGDMNDRDSPAVIEELSGMGISSLSCGDRHSFAISADGAVLGWGSNEFGQVGIGHRGDTFLSPTPIAALAGLVVTAMSSGDRHSAAVTNVGALYTWGCGIDGQCGHGTIRDTPRPRFVAALAHVSVVAVHCGHNFTIAVTDTHDVYAWGNNTYGQLGCTATSGKSSLPVRVHTPSNATVTGVACAHFHCVITTDAAVSLEAPQLNGADHATFAPPAAAATISAAVLHELDGRSLTGEVQAGRDDQEADANDFEDKDSLLSSITATNGRLQHVLEHYAVRTAQCNAVAAKQNRDLVISDILRLSSSSITS
jgi:alpha-tubulin suppressor-like RCC1 family protein